MAAEQGHPKKKKKIKDRKESEDGVKNSFQTHNLSRGLVTRYM